MKTSGSLHDRPGRGASAGILMATLLALAQSAVQAEPPGIIVDHSPASSGLYVGSPSLAVLTNGEYAASHDFFGPNSGEHEKATTVIFGSRDHGASWRKLSEVHGQFWSSLFVHQANLYLIGTDRHHGNVVIRCSRDGGVSWTDPTNAACGLIRDNGQYHCAPMPVVEHAGRLWRPMEHRDPPEGWGVNYRAGVLSIPVEANILVASNWTLSALLPSNTNWLKGTFGGWLEGNFVVGKKGEMFDILRVDKAGFPEKAALVHIIADGRALSFDPDTDFINFPGGAKKFCIRFDPKSGLYWALVNSASQPAPTGVRPSRIRNKLALATSGDCCIGTSARCC